jgi:HCOMODA/2-hydroxy-3-carboxy-muconic semialdehyde decarboxylase
MPDLTDLSRRVRMAGRALARASLVHAYGHCSQRIDEHSFLVSPPKPLGLVGADEPCSVVPLDGPLPEGVLGEVRIHREIYRLRPDVKGVIRSTPPKSMTLGAMRLTPKARYGYGAYFAPQPPLWDNPRLLRSDELTVRLAQTLGKASAIFMRGNGLVTAGSSVEEAVVLTWYAEDAARVELEFLAANMPDVGILSDEDIESRATWAGRIRERMWEYLTAGDPEEQPGPANF